ncbi:hypothetical protein ACP275_14G305800 [Erythranthe tilingii]
MSFWIPARDLSIWMSVDPECWDWIQPDSSNPEEVAELVRVVWLDISGKVDGKSLRLKTSYSAYLLYKVQDLSEELQTSTAAVRFTKEVYDEISDEGYTVFLDTKSSLQENGRFPHLRSDGWMEIKLGEFFNNLGDDGEVEMKLFNKKDNFNYKSGLTVRGIDIRPN